MEVFVVAEKSHSIDVDEQVALESRVGHLAPFLRENVGCYAEHPSNGRAGWERRIISDKCLPYWILLLQ